MAEHTAPGESIEGNKVSGISRKPIQSKGIIQQNGLRLYKYVAKFNVKAKVTDAIGSLEDSLLKSEGETAEAAFKNQPPPDIAPDAMVICDEATCLSKGIIKKASMNQKQSNASGTHSAFSWNFSRQTNVRITRSHKEIMDALQKAGRLPYSTKLLESDAATSSPIADAQI